MNDRQFWWRYYISNWLYLYTITIIRQGRAKVLYLISFVSEFLVILKFTLQFCQILKAVDSRHLPSYVTSHPNRQQSSEPEISVGYVAAQVQILPA
jgi:hypothetical protein